MIQSSNSLNEAASDFKNLLKSIVSIPDEEWGWLTESLEDRIYNSGEILYGPGDVDAGIHYLCQGLVRYFYSTEAGEERNHAFAAEGNLVGCFPAFIGTGPCNFTVEALEPSTSLLIPSDTVKAFVNRHECWSQLKLQLIGHVAIRKAEREAEFLKDTAETRYRSFLSRYASFSHRIPQYHIASFLGITPVGLSRIRKRINLG